MQFMFKNMGNDDKLGIILFVLFQKDEEKKENTEETLINSNQVMKH